MPPTTMVCSPMYPACSRVHQVRLIMLPTTMATAVHELGAVDVLLRVSSKYRHSKYSCGGCPVAGE